MDGCEKIIEAAECLPAEARLIVYLLVAAVTGLVTISGTILSAVWSEWRRDRALLTALLQGSERRSSRDSAEDRSTTSP